MFKSIKIEGEGMELILKNSHGDHTIIPANKRDWVKNRILLGKHSDIDEYVNTLPQLKDYAEDGTVIPGDPPSKKKPVIMEDIGNDTLVAPELDEVVIKDAGKPSIGRFFKMWGDNIPASDNFMGALGQGIGAALSLPQAAATYIGSDGRETQPSKALKGTKFDQVMDAASNLPGGAGIVGSVLGSELGQDVVLDPLNIPIAKGVKAVLGGERIAGEVLEHGDDLAKAGYLTQEQAVQARADRLLFQESKWVDQRPGLKEKLINTVDNQLPEIPHEIVLDNNTLNLERLNPKNKRKMLSFDDVDLGSDLTLRNNPSRVADQNTILGKNRSIKSVLNKKTHESIDLKTWQDTDGKIYYYMSASMPSSKLKAGKAYLELEKHIPKGESILENSSLSYDSFLNVLKRTKNPKFETFVKGKIPMNDNAKNNLLKIKGDSYLGSNYFNSEELANSANKELIELTNKYSLPNPTVVPVTSSSGKIKAYEIQLPNIGLKKLYTILGLTSAGTYLQSQQNKSEQ